MSSHPRDGFTSDIAAYDAWYRTPWGAYAEAREQELLLELARPRAGERALDVGCGTGRTVAWLLSMGVDAWGGEPAPDMRTAAQRRLRERGHDPGRVTAAVAEELPFADKSFDLVMAITVLEFLDDRAAALREMARVCRRGLFIGTLNRSSEYATQIERGEVGETLSRARLFTVDQLLVLIREHVAPREVAWRTTLLGPRTDDPDEVEAQRRLDDEPGADRLPTGAFIAVMAELT